VIKAFIDNIDKTVSFIQHFSHLPVFTLSRAEMISSQSLSSLDQGITGAAATRGVFPQDAAFYEILDVP